LAAAAAAAAGVVVVATAGTVDAAGVAFCVAPLTVAGV